MMKPVQKQIITDAQDLEDVTLVSVLLGLFAIILGIAFAISYVGGF